MNTRSKSNKQKGRGSSRHLEREQYRKTWRFVTCNPHKVECARRISHELKVPVLHLERNLTEIQGDWMEVALDKRDMAMTKYAFPVVVEDVSLEIPALGGVPGPYVKWWLRHAGPSGIWDAVKHLPQPVAATARCTLAYGYDGYFAGVVHAEIDGFIVPPRPGAPKRNWGFNTIFEDERSGLTLAQMNDTQYDKLSHRGQVWREFLTETPHAEK